MVLPVEIRLATPADAIAIRAIYAPIVSSTPISFELEPPTVEEMATRISAVLPTYPWLVLEDGPRGGGLGGALYRSLLDVLTRQGYRLALAGVTTENGGSVRVLPPARG